MKVSVEKRRNIQEHLLNTVTEQASMKVYTSRHRTNGPAVILALITVCLLESPHDKSREIASGVSLASFHTPTSMKASPTRNGSQTETSDMPPLSQSLNESPSQKEGKIIS